MRVGPALVGLILILGLHPSVVVANDYFLTMGGGYNPGGNQASLEANVLFVQSILTAPPVETGGHAIFFADGDDPRPDLQVVATRPDQNPGPATKVLATLHRRRDDENVDYRNHRIPGLAGGLDPNLVQRHLQQIARTVREGDRLFIYVTAHGSAGPASDSQNTTIDCWNDRRITARELSKWLDAFPPSVPVIMVMAQCYCGGFTHTIFKDFNSRHGLSPQVRVGFFAQQHNLPAAGCRPDISNDEEFSSYFWGALAGRSRNGVPIQTADGDGDGSISLAEAYAYAVIASPTIDIPLRSSEVLLRTYSRLNSPPTPSALAPENRLLMLHGPLEDLIRQADPMLARIVTELSASLGHTPQETVQTVIARQAASRRDPRQSFDPRRRQGSGRRQLLQQVREKWPELGDPERWEKSELLAATNQAQLLQEIQQLPGWKAYEDRRQQSRAAEEQAERQELREVRYRRLTSALEVIVLAANLPRFADAAIVQRYRDMIELERTSLRSE